MRMIGITRPVDVGMGHVVDAGVVGAVGVGLGHAVAERRPALLHAAGDSLDQRRRRRRPTAADGTQARRVEVGEPRAS